MYNEHDYPIEARRPDIILVSNNKVCTIIDVAIPGDKRVSKKETEKVEKYQDLRWEIELNCQMNVQYLLHKIFFNFLRVLSLHTN